MQWWTTILKFFQWLRSKASQNKSKTLLTAGAALLTFVLVVALLETCQQVRQAQNAMNHGFKRAAQSVAKPPIQRERTLQKTQDSINLDGQKARLRINNMSVYQLQCTIDSLYPPR